MGERARIFGKLRRTQGTHVSDALDGARALVGGKFLITENREPFLEAKLEPVATGDAIAGPVVEILVGDYALDMRIVDVCGGARQGKDIFVIENVQSLVFHRAHVEVGHGDDVEDVEIILAAKYLFIPAHGPFQRVHRVGRARLLAMLDIDAELHGAARLRPETVMDRTKITADEREEITGLGVGIVPDRIMACGVGEISGIEQVAIAKQHGRFRLVGFDARGENTQHIGAIEEIGDAPESLRFALGAIGRSGTIEPHQLGVGRRIKDRLDGECEGSRGRCGNRQAIWANVTRIQIQGDIPYKDLCGVEIVTVKDKWSTRLSLGVGLDRQLRPDARGAHMQQDVEIDSLDEIIGSAIVAQANGLGGVCAHVDRLHVRQGYAASTRRRQGPLWKALDFRPGQGTSVPARASPASRPAQPVGVSSGAWPDVEHAQGRPGEVIRSLPHRPRQTAVELENARLKHGSQRHGGGQICVFKADFSPRISFTHDGAQLCHRIRLRVHIAQMRMLIEQNEAEDIRVIVKKAAEQINQRPDFRREGLRALADVRNGTCERAVMRQKNSGRDLLLRGEIAIERGIGDTDSQGQITDRGPIDAFCREKAQGFGFDSRPRRSAIAGMGWLFCPCHGQAAT